LRFLDTNVIIRYLVADDARKAEASKDLFLRTQADEEELFTTEAMVAEAVYVLASPRSLYKLGRDQTASRLRMILGLRGLKLPNKSTCLRALDLFASTAWLDFEDALALAHMQELGIHEIVSYDEDFDRIAGATRVEP
jgi:predicted nucleic acid-binding protein